MSREQGDAILCGECPLLQLGDPAVAEQARQWAFSPPFEHEGFVDPRFPKVGMVAMDLGSKCHFRQLAGLCKQAAPEIEAAPESA